ISLQKVSNICNFQLCEESLADWLSRNMENRNQDQIRSWFKQIILALQFIHSNNTIHPSNILVASEETVKICDLGIATDCNDGEEMRSDIGTQMYRAPEQNFFYDQMVDIFSAGLILLEMCAMLSEAHKIEV
ncbi:hypothetical protein PMAYCL1PPCAC_08422, partial [Pristionchus mayeri]